MSDALPYPRDIPPVWLLVAMVAMASLHTLAPVARVVPSPWNRLGFVVIALAIGLMAVSAWRFRTSGTGIRPFLGAVTLVIGGPFRFTRNPMYLGLAGVALGMAVCLGTASPLVVPPLLLLLLHQRFVRREEEFLRQCFGAPYEEYCRRVRRWI